eukprot:Skav226461  [mRNA]  locus=scaffold1781:88836:95522:+ [translate_table: standard]
MLHRFGCQKHRVTQELPQECCSTGFARLFPTADALDVDWEDASRWAASASGPTDDTGPEVHWDHPSFSSAQRAWEASMSNASIRISEQVTTAPPPAEAAAAPAARRDSNILPFGWSTPGKVVGRLRRVRVGDLCSTRLGAMGGQRMEVGVE